jgi:hypothetical protein
VSAGVQCQEEEVDDEEMLEVGRILGNVLKKVKKRMEILRKKVTEQT